MESDKKINNLVDEPQEINNTEEVRRAGNLQVQKPIKNGKRRQQHKKQHQRNSQNRNQFHNSTPRGDQQFVHVNEATTLQRRNFQTDPNENAILFTDTFDKDDFQDTTISSLFNLNDLSEVSPSTVGKRSTTLANIPPEELTTAQTIPLPQSTTSTTTTTTTTTTTESTTTSMVDIETTTMNDDHEMGDNLEMTTISPELESDQDFILVPETEITVDAPELSTPVPESLTSTVGDSDLLTTVVDNADTVDNTLTNSVDEKFTTNMETEFTTSESRVSVTATTSVAFDNDQSPTGISTDQSQSQTSISPDQSELSSNSPDQSESESRVRSSLSPKDNMHRKRVLTAARKRFGERLLSS